MIESAERRLCQGRVPVGTLLVLVAIGVGAAAEATGLVEKAWEWVMPPLGRSSPATNIVKSRQQLKQIGVVIELYAAANEGRYPGRLGELLLTLDVGPDSFNSPRSDREVPEWVKAGSVTEQAAWVDSGSDYRYLGKGLRSKPGSDVVVAFERLDLRLKEGVVVLFGDGRVEFVPYRELTGLLVESARLRAGTPQAASK